MQSNRYKPHYENEMPFEVPESWEWTNLGEISNYGNCENVDVNDIPSNGWVLELEDLEKDSAKVIQRLTKDERDIKGVRHSFHKGDVLYSKLRTYLNKVTVALEDGFCTTEIIPVTCMSFILPEYLNHVLRSKYFVDYTIQCGYGVKMPRLSTTDACNGLIPLPPYNEQKHIVASIESWFQIIDILESDKLNLDEAIQKAKSKILDLAIHGKLVPQDPSDEPAIELLKRINPKFTPCDNAHYENVPTNWALARVEDIGQLLSGRDLTNDECNSDNMGLPYLIGASNIEGDTFSFIRWTEKPQVISQMGDILISCKGTIGTIVKNDIGDMHIARQFMAIRPNTNYITSDYLHICLITAIEEIKKDARGVIPGISRDDILTKVFTIPPLNEQRRIVAEMNLYYRVFDNISANL